MKLNQSHVFESKFHAIKLIATEFDEPHPGRLIWRFELYIEGELVKNSYLNYQWSGLWANLDYFQLEPEDGSCIFIPQENPLIYLPHNKTYFQLHLPEDSNNDFVKNIFSEGRLLILKQRGFSSVRLNNLATQHMVFQEDKYQILDGFYIDDILVIKYKDLLDYEEYTKKFDFEKMAFEA